MAIETSGRGARLPSVVMQVLGPKRHQLGLPARRVRGDRQQRCIAQFPRRVVEGGQDRLNIRHVQLAGLLALMAAGALLRGAIPEGACSAGGPGR